MATSRRIETELTLEELKRENQKLLESNAALQLQLSQLSQNKLGNFVEFSRAELEEATNNFDKSCMIGEGGFARVYKGFLRNTNVAIKILKSESSQGDIEFIQEVEILRKVSHPNLVSLIGANRDAGALVFEYVPNGSLDKFLTKGKDTPRNLTWKERIRIASEICSALIFLHSVPPHGIVHGDLKPENVLLDSNLTCKLADFGISRELNKTDNRSTIFHFTENPKFTPGYCALEFLQSYELTPQCDIYSFGIILLQFLTGRRPERIWYSVEEALEKGKLAEEVDSSADWPMEEAEKLASLGLRCCHPLSTKRPASCKDVWPSIESTMHAAMGSLRIKSFELELEIKKKFKQTSERVKSVDVHPTKPWILVSLYSGNVRIWNYESQIMVKSFEVAELPVRSAKFIARKQWMVTGADDMYIRVYDYNTMEKVKEFEAHADYIRCVAVHPTRPYVLTASDDNLIKLWDWEKRWICKQIFEGHSHYAMQVVFNPNMTNTFASASLDHTVKIWNIGSFNPIFTLDAHFQGVNCVDYLNGGDRPYIITGSDDHTVKVWDYETRTCVQTLQGHTHNVTSVCFHPQLLIIITASEDSTVRIWDSTTYRLEKTLNYGLERVWAVGCMEGSRRMVIGCDEGTAVIEFGFGKPIAGTDSNVTIREMEMRQSDTNTEIDATNVII